MKRDIETDLNHWKQQKDRMPILLHGARQVGKSFVVEKFGRASFKNLIIINFELQPELISCFNSLKPHEILTALSLSLHVTIRPGETLLFLDEVQDCPNAIRSLRYFKEQLPELHVIAAGSLLEFTLNQADFRMPVGRVQSLYMKPLSFKEFLTALNYNDLRDFIEEININETIPLPVHETLLKLIKIYLVLGGMPAVLQAYLTSKNSSEPLASDFNMSQLNQTILMNTYRNDFGKYAKHTQIHHVQRVFEKVPGMVGEQIKYSKIDPNARAYQMKSACELLEQAGLLYPVYSTAASGLPLISLINEKKFKIVFLDVGLMTKACNLSAEILLKDNTLLVNKGAIAEQFVGQELLAYSPRIDEAKLYFWHREEKSSTAEVDFVININSKIIPIEVKAGSTGQLKSLHLFMKEKKSSLGIRISQQTLHFDGSILSIPFYLVGEIERLLI